MTRQLKASPVRGAGPEPAEQRAYPRGQVTTTTPAGRKVSAVDIADQRSDLDRQVAGLAGWAAGNGFSVDEVVVEVGSGINGKRRKLQRVLADPAARMVIVGHGDRLARFGVENLEAALSAQGRRVVVVEEGETGDDLVGDMAEVLTWLCARLYGQRAARNRALKALGRAWNDVGPMAVRFGSAR